MCDALVWFFGTFVSVNWLEVTKALAPVATAVIAFFALRNWQRQDKAKREAEFLDALLEATHAFIAEMSKCLTYLEMTKIGMESYAPTGEGGDEANKAIKGVIAYIEKNGERDSKHILHELEHVQLTVINLKSLAAKGQVFKFDGYVKCQNAILMLTWNFDRLTAFSSVIAMTTLNWEHPDVLKTVRDVTAVSANDIRECMGKCNIDLIEFARDTYKRIYG